VLDLHAVSSGGGTSLTTIGTTLAGQDGQTVAGLPIADNAVLVGWGGLTTIADTIAELQLFSQDQLDPANTEDFTLGAAGVEGIRHVFDYLPFKSGSRVLSMKQNTAGANNIGYYLDYYPQNPPRAPQQHEIFGAGNSNWYGSVTFGGALTAITWGSQAFAPTKILPAGVYSIQGCWVAGLTNYGLVRFQHADFGAFLPGIPVIDQTKAAARATVVLDPIFQRQGYQFSHLSEILKKPCEPTFKVGAQSTGLVIQAAAITADTPIVTLNLVKVG